MIEESGNSKEFAKTLRGRIGMPEPEDPGEQIQQVWDVLEEKLGVIPEAIDALKAGAEPFASDEHYGAFDEGLTALVEGIEVAVDAVGELESVLVELELLPEAELEDNAAPAAEA